MYESADGALGSTDVAVGYAEGVPGAAVPLTLVDEHDLDNPLFDADVALDTFELGSVRSESSMAHRHVRARLRAAPAANACIVHCVRSSFAASSRNSLVIPVPPPAPGPVRGSSP